MAFLSPNRFLSTHAPHTPAPHLDVDACVVVQSSRDVRNRHHLAALLRKNFRSPCTHVAKTLQWDQDRAALSKVMAYTCALIMNAA